MTRRFTAARRAADLEPITFELAYEVPAVPRPGDGLDASAGSTDLARRGDGMREQVDTFTCRGKVSTLLLAEFARQADLDVATPDGAALIADFFRQAFGSGEEADKEYKRFFRIITEQFDDDVLMDVLSELVERLSGRPSRQQSPSRAGRSTTGTSSTGAGSPEAEVVEGTVVTLAGDGPAVAVDITEQELAEVLRSRQPASSTSTSATSSTSSTPTSSTGPSPRKKKTAAAASTRRSRAT